MTLNRSVYRSRLKFGDRTKNGSSRFMVIGYKISDHIVHMRSLS